MLSNAQKPIKFLIFLLLAFTVVVVVLPSSTCLAMLVHTWLNYPPSTGRELLLYELSALIAAAFCFGGSLVATTCLFGLWLPISQSWLGTKIQQLVEKLAVTYWTPPGPKSE